MAADPSVPNTIADIAVDTIDVVGARRKVDPAWVGTLASLFEKQGQLQPIDLVSAGDRYRLVSGHHRLAAARQLGWSTVAAIVKDPAVYASEADITLREITENLARRELSALDRAVDIVRWREAYEAANGAVKRGRPGKLSQVATISDEVTGRFAESFSEAARKALGLNRDAISRAMLIATIGADVRDVIALHPIADNQSELLKLAFQSPERQARVAAMIASEPALASSVAEAVALLDKAPPPAAEPRWQKVSSAFSSMKTADQHAFFAAHEESIRAWLTGRSA